MTYFSVCISADYIAPCSKQDPKFNECAIRNGQKAIPRLIKGECFIPSGSACFTFEVAAATQHLCVLRTFLSHICVKTVRSRDSCELHSVEGKGKGVSVRNKEPRHENVLGKGSIAPLPGPCLIRGWVGHRAGLDTMWQGERSSWSCRESNPGRPACSLVSIPTELQKT
jgi:hypothetical protein